MRLVDDHDHVVSARELRMLGAGLLLGLGEPELLQGREVDAPGAGVRQLVTQLAASSDGDRLQISSYQSVDEGSGYDGSACKVTASITDTFGKAK